MNFFDSRDKNNLMLTKIEKVKNLHGPITF